MAQSQGGGQPFVSHETAFPLKVKCVNEGGLQRDENAFEI
jgi:hypothetical protein